MSKQSLATRLLGRRVVPVFDLTLAPKTFTLRPSLVSGEHYGTIESVYQNEGKIYFLLSGPTGDLAEVFSEHVTLVEESTTQRQKRIAENKGTN